MFRKCSPLIDVLCWTWFLILCEPLCFGGYKVSGFYFITAFKWQLLKYRVDVSVVYNLLRQYTLSPACGCNLKNVTQSLVALCFTVSSLFTVFSHKSLIIVISTDAKGKLVPFHAIHLEWRYRVTINNVRTKSKWVVHFKTPSLYPQVRNPWYPLNRKLGGSLFWLDVLEKLKVLYRYWDFKSWFIWPVA